MVRGDLYGWRFCFAWRNMYLPVSTCCLVALLPLCASTGALLACGTSPLFFSVFFYAVSYKQTILRICAALLVASAALLLWQRPSRTGPSSDWNSLVFVDGGRGGFLLRPRNGGPPRGDPTQTGRRGCDEPAHGGER